MRPWEALLEIFVIFGCPWGPKFLRKCGFSGFSNAVPKRSTFWDISGVSEGVDTNRWFCIEILYSAAAPLLGAKGSLGLLLVEL